MNLIGFFSVYNKEIRRFLKVYNQTLISPVINALLFLAIFMLAIGKKISFGSGISFGQFMAPGLIAMVIIQNAFANSSSSITMAKILGHIIDFLIPPLSALNLSLAICLAALTRGILVGIIAYFAINLFIPLTIYSWIHTLIYFLLISFSLGAIGLLCGLFANSFDQMSAVTSYVITPLSFLSGTFYSVKSLPEFWHNFSHFNPFFYMIDGLRYSIIGYHDGNLKIGMIYLLSLNIILLISCVLWLKSGYRIKD